MYNQAYFDKQKAGLDLHNVIVESKEIFDKLQINIPGFKQAFEDYLSETEDHFITKDDLAIYAAIRLREEYLKNAKCAQSNFCAALVSLYFWGRCVKDYCEENEYQVKDCDKEEIESYRQSTIKWLNECKEDIKVCEAQNCLHEGYLYFCHRNNYSVNNFSFSNDYV